MATAASRRYSASFSSSGDVPKSLLETIQRAQVAATPDPHWNLLKLHTDQFAITFLTYPDVDSDPHPALAAKTVGGESGGGTC